MEFASPVAFTNVLTVKMNLNAQYASQEQLWLMVIAVDVLLIALLAMHF